MFPSSRLGKASILILLALSACGGFQGNVLTNSTGDSQSEIEVKKIPPDDFAGLTNPLKKTEENLAEGESLYQANCSSCHGTGGQGDGLAAGGINPVPQILARTQSEQSDAYLYWRIAEGGLMEPFNSLMPAWKGLLDEDQIWQIITYIRTMGD
jgi:mono/diheme cytochrome c family protein